MSKTFTEGLRSNYIKACTNNYEQKDASVYYCATAKKDLTTRCLDLNCDYVFCHKCKSEAKKNIIKEYRLEAFLVKKAMKDKNHRLPIKDKKWVLLDAERNFADSDLSGEGEGRKFDLLAYETDTKTFIILELKIERAFSKACRELSCYTSTIRKHINEANTCYGTDAENIRAYIVWPANDNPRKLDSPWGLIEYDKSFLEKDTIENIKFDIIKEPD